MGIRNMGAYMRKIQVKLLLLGTPHLDDIRVVRIDKPHGRRVVVPALEVV